MMTERQGAEKILNAIWELSSLVKDGQSAEETFALIEGKVKQAMQRPEHAALCVEVKGKHYGSCGPSDFSDCILLRDLEAVLGEPSRLIIGYREHPHDGRPIFTPEEEKFADMMASTVVRILTRFSMIQGNEEIRNKYEKIFNAGNDAIFIHNMSRSFLEVNYAACELLGYSKAELLTMGPDQISKEVHADSSDIMETVKNNGFHIFTGILLDKEGKEIPVEINSRMIRLEDKDAVISAVRDISNRRAREKQLDLNHQRLQNIIKGTGAGTWEWHVPTGETIFNEEWASMLGFELEELSPASIETWGKLTHPEDLKYAQQLLQAHFSKETEHYEAEIRMQHKNGDWIWIHDRGKVISRTADGEPEWMFGTHQNITHRKLAEEELQESESKLRNIIENSTNLFYSHTTDHVLTYLSPQVENILGYTQEEAMIKWTDLASDNPINAIGYEHTVKAIETGKRQAAYELELIHKNGKKVFVEVREAPIVQNGETVSIVGALIDITERREAEERQRQLEYEIQQSQKLESIGTLAGGIAHDFNNILTSMYNYIDMSMIKVSEASQVHFNLSQMQKGAERAANLVKQLMAFSRKQLISPTLLNLHTEIDEFMTMLHPLIGFDISIVKEFYPEDPYVLADKSQLEQIIMNLIINARDAILENPEEKSEKIICIRTEVGAHSELPQSSGDELQPGEYVMISIEDNGIGMSSTVVGKIFDPFFTTREVGKGSGLGLSTVYGIVKQNNAMINVSSEPGIGSTFTIYWKRAQSGTHKGVKIVNRSSGQGREKIILVDDEEQIRSSTALVPESKGYQVSAYSVGEKALNAILNNNETFDVLISDLRMPNMDGPTLLKNVRRKFANARVILCTGHRNDSALFRELEEQDIPLLSKPYSINDLISLIDREPEN